MNAYELITNDIIAALEAGVAPWRQPWNGSNAPRNLRSKKAYRGINVFLLASAGYASPWWVTYKQAQELGGNVRKGEKGRRIVFWSVREAEEGDADARTRFALRYYTVFNVAQCDGLEVPAQEAAPPVDTLAAAEAIVDGYQAGPTVDYTGSAAYYRPSTDHVTLPPRDTFTSTGAFYSTLFHELVHSTGHWSRLRRFEASTAHAFGSETYSKEELVAELGAAFLLGEAGILEPQLEQNAAYLKGWVAALRGDARLVVHAAAAAQKAADHILHREAA